jgi:hypothetical protein
MLKEYGSTPDNTCSDYCTIKLEGKQGKLTPQGWFLIEGEKPTRLPIIVETDSGWERTADIIGKEFIGLNKPNVLYEFKCLSSTIATVDNIRAVCKKDRSQNYHTPKFSPDKIIKEESINGVKRLEDNSKYVWFDGDAFSLRTGVMCGSGMESLSNLIEKYILGTQGRKDYGHLGSFLTQGHCALVRYTIELANRNKNRTIETDKLIIHEVRSVADLSQLGVY